MLFVYWKVFRKRNQFKFDIINMLWEHLKEFHCDFLIIAIALLFLTKLNFKITL
jgi:hypothetical protein